MRLSYFTILSIIISMFLLMSCGESTTENEYLGKVPSIVKKYVNEMEEKEEASEKASSMEEAMDYAQQVKKAKAELADAVDAYVAANPLDKPLPLEALSDTPYEIKEVIVNKVSSGNLNIKFSLTISKDIKNKYGGIEKRLFIYYKAVDLEGKDIPDSKTVATNFDSTELKAGVEYEAFGSWNNSEIAKMENFAKIVEITKEGYEKK